MNAPEPIGTLSAESPAPAAGPAHYPVLDGIRGMAISLVLVAHFSEGAIAHTSAGRVLVEILHAGRHGVDLFFVLSGFLITGILYDAKPGRHYFRNFYGRRTLRIFPLYYGVLLVTLVILPAMWPGFATGMQANLDNQHGLWLYYCNFVMAAKQTWVYLGPVSMAHFWSLAVEEQFYLVWPFVVLIAGRRTLMGICGGMIVTAVVTRAVLIASGWSGLSVFVLTPCRIDSLAAGALVALAMRGQGGLSCLRRPAVIAAIISAALLPPVFIMTRFSQLLVQTSKYLVLAVLFASLMVLALNAARKSPLHRCLAWRPLRFMGKYSYGIYVFHVLLMPMFVAAFGPEVFEAHLGIPRPLAVLAFALAAAAGSIAVALLSWHLVEKQFLRLKRYFAD